MTRSKKAPSAAVQGGSARPGSVRIIGGRWRGRRVPVAALPGLRPTPDRVRETLYNWLQGTLIDARVLDLYAGTGALGLEALSRGARHATFVERDAQVARQLTATLHLLGATDAVVRCEDAGAFLDRGVTAAGGAYHGVLLDPPFAAAAHADLCTLLDRNGWLADGAWIYLESPSDKGAVELPAGWRIVRTLKAGAVTATLARRASPSAGASTPVGAVDTAEDGKP